MLSRDFKTFDILDIVVHLLGRTPGVEQYGCVGCVGCLVGIHVMK